LWSSWSYLNVYKGVTNLAVPWERCWCANQKGIVRTVHMDLMACSRIRQQPQAGLRSGLEETSSALQKVLFIDYEDILWPDFDNLRGAVGGIHRKLARLMSENAVKLILLIDGRPRHAHSKLSVKKYSCTAYFRRLSCNALRAGPHAPTS